MRIALPQISWYPAHRVNLGIAIGMVPYIAWSWRGHHIGHCATISRLFLYGYTRTLLVSIKTMLSITLIIGTIDDSENYIDTDLIGGMAGCMVKKQIYTYLGTYGLDNADELSY
jgi:hypothetical protein